MPQLAIEESALLFPEQIRSLLEWTRENTGGQTPVYPFLAPMAGAALLPGEAVALRVDDVTLLEGGFGEMLVGAGEGRKVPVTPGLSDLLRNWIRRAGLKLDDPLFSGEGNRSLSSAVYRQVWAQAREAVLRPDEAEAGLGEHVTSLRDSCLEKWLKAGVPAWSVAEWAGLNPSWLALRFPHCFRLDGDAVDWDHLAKATALPGSHKS
ncbi:MAG: hypothetical protein ACRDP3_07935 [Streptomyces sp.]|uniref:hypothetical protein n=1 Tax=Streptomyces sp. TaxID=1931 RepID=UPI003D6A4659